MKIFFIKIFIGFGIFYWLITSGKLDFSLVLKSFEAPMFFFLAAFFIIIQFTLSSYRLGFLLKCKSTSFKLNRLISIQWIAQLFSTVLPGGFTSDLIKIGYIHELDNKLSKTYILFAVIFDRIIGLSSLLFISGVTGLCFFNELVSLNPMIEKIIYINIFLFFSSIIGICFIFIKEGYHNTILKLIPGKRLKDLITEIWTLRNQKKILLLSYIMSIISHFLGILSFWTVNHQFFQGPLPFKYLTTLIPLGLLTTAIPISPGGIGVGHAAFATLFNFIHHTNGASLFNVFWILIMLVSCLGIFPYLLRKKQKDTSETSTL